MAAIDKIYANYNQHAEFYEWVRVNRPDALKYMAPVDYFDHLNHDEMRPVSLFPEEVDMWLLGNCPLEWVVARIRRQYDMDAGAREG